MSDLIAVPRSLLVEIDSELSAIAHGRPPSASEKLKGMYQQLRDHYENKAVNEGDPQVWREILVDIRDEISRSMRAAESEGDESGPWLPVGVMNRINEALGD